jgi:hypothetical protein
MTQDSDSGDAVGDAGPTTDRSASCRAKVKIDLIENRFGTAMNAAVTAQNLNYINRRSEMDRRRLVATAATWEPN